MLLCKVAHSLLLRLYIELLAYMGLDIWSIKKNCSMHYSFNFSDGDLCRQVIQKHWRKWRFDLSRIHTYVHDCYATPCTIILSHYNNQADIGEESSQPDFLTTISIFTILLFKRECLCMTMCLVGSIAVLSASSRVLMHWLGIVQELWTSSNLVKPHQCWDTKVCRVL